MLLTVVGSRSRLSHIKFKGEGLNIDFRETTQLFVGPFLPYIARCTVILPSLTYVAWSELDALENLDLLRLQVEEPPEAFHIAAVRGLIGACMRSFSTVVRRIEVGHQEGRQGFQVCAEWTPGASVSH
jgi:hypothetical protein